MNRVTEGTATMFCDAEATLGESLVWDGARDLLWWTDIPRGLLHACDSAGEIVSTSQLPPPLPSFQPRRDGGFVAALQDAIVLTGPDGSFERELARVPDRPEGVRLNEGKCDPFGRFVVGGMNLSPDIPNASVFSVEPTGEVRVLRGGFGVANGMEWSRDGETMYVTDTGTSTIYRGSYGPAGDLGELEPFIVGKSFDGLAYDDEGCFWTAVNGDGKVERYSPDGSLLETVTVPAPNVTSVGFGGPDLATLFIATAREQMTEDDLRAAPGAGGVFAVTTRVHGFAPHTFAG
jgi:sugar lactone lactonase YvrE